MKGLLQFVEVIVDCWNDNRDIFVGVSWFDRNRDRLVKPMADGVANEADITVEPAGKLSAFKFGRLECSLVELESLVVGLLACLLTYHTIQNSNWQLLRVIVFMMAML